MANRIAKGFSVCAAIVGVLCLLTGVGIAVCAWVLDGILPSGFYYTTPDNGDVYIYVDNYWWGGMIYIIPGILGIIAGCTRNVCAMVLYMIFNIICCICSCAVVVICGLAIVAWSVVDDKLQSGMCIQALSGNCVCKNGGDIITLYGGNCDAFYSVETVVGAMVAMGALSTLLSFIASYVSCCSLCNQEENPVGNIIITGGTTGVYQPPPIVINNTTQFTPGYPQMGGYQPNQLGGAPQGGYCYPPQLGNSAYGGQGGFPMPYSTKDTSKLVKNEII